METWTKRVLLAVAIVLSASNAFAQERQGSGQAHVVDPDLERKDIDIDAFDSEDFELGVYYGILSIEDFGSDTVAGVRAAPRD